MNHTSEPRSHPTAGLICYIGACLALFPANRASASLLFDFVQSGTGDVLATLELAGLPAEFSDIVSLTFTTEGDSIFGFGAGVYTGTFDFGQNRILSDGGTGLQGDPVFNVVVDVSPPPTTINPVVGMPELTMTYSGIGSSDMIEYSDVFSLPAPLVVGVTGDWVAASDIPEPTSLILWSLVIATAPTGWVRSRQRHT